LRFHNYKDDTPFNSEGEVKAIGSVGVGKNTNGNSAVSFNYPDPDPRPAVWWDNGEADKNNAFKVDIPDGSGGVDEYSILHTGNSAPLLAAALRDEDYTVRLDTSDVLGNGISRTEIEQVLTDNGVSVPLLKNWKFFVKDGNNKIWFITYFKDIDKYAVEKMVLK